MKVNLFGTGSIYTKYHSACTLIDDALMVDMPNGTLKKLLREGFLPENIHTILITHLHGDHIADIPFFLKYVEGYLKKEERIILIGPKGIKKAVIQLFKAYRFEDEKEIEELFTIDFVELVEDEVKIGQYHIQSYLMEHGEEKPALGYVINQKIGMSGDTSYCQGIEKIVQNADTIICDTSFLKGDAYHMGIDNLELLSSKYPNKKFLATHLRDKTREILNQKEYKNFWTKEDGFIFYV